MYGANQNQNPTPIVLVEAMGQITGCTVKGDLCVMCLNALGCASGFHGIPNCFMNGGMKVRRLSFLLHNSLVVNMSEKSSLVTSDPFKPLSVNV